MAKGQDSLSKDSGYEEATGVVLGYEAALALVEERYYMASAAVEQFNTATEKTKSSLDGELSGFGFDSLGRGESIYEILEDLKKRKAEIANQNDEIEKQNELKKYGIDLDTKAAHELASYTKLREEASKSLQSIETKAYQALGNELLKLVEIHKFSIGEFAKAMAEQVKIELTGLAAKAAIWAIYETAMGLKDLAMGSPGTAGMHFAAAEEFGVIAGASLAAAAGVQALVPGDSEEPSSSSSSSSGSSSSSSSVQAYDSSSTGATQQVTVNIYNPLSEQNWQKIVEESIVPALNNAAEKNITISVNK
ncbi:MAG: hypothetical protein HYV24_04625 [Deltaproteobacteria bacterium]|nr:hypothetical protein [Deltaproteobacteria bacterium]